MVKSGLIDPGELLDLFTKVEPELFRFPAVNPPSLRTAVESLAAGDATEATLDDFHPDSSAG